MEERKRKRRRFREVRRDSQRCNIRVRGYVRKEVNLRIWMGRAEVGQSLRKTRIHNWEK